MEELEHTIVFFCHGKSFRDSLQTLRKLYFISNWRIIRYRNFTFKILKQPWKSVPHFFL